jgi:uncharacterized protein YggE
MKYFLLPLQLIFILSNTIRQQPRAHAAVTENVTTTTTTTPTTTATPTAATMIPPSDAATTLPPIRPIPVINFPLPDNTLSITGSASFNIPSDIIKVGITIETNSTVAKLALQQNNNISNSIDNVLTDLNIPLKNITTTDFRITPRYDSVYIKDNNTYISVFTGYFVTNSLDISLSDLSMATKLIDKAVDGGANKIQYVSFDVSTELQKKVQYDLIKYATKDAVSKAEILTDSLGLEIIAVKTVRLNENNFQATPIMYNYASRMADSAMAGAAPSAKLYTGNSKQTVTVDVTFLIRNTDQQNASSNNRYSN